MFLVLRPSPDADPLLATADPRVVSACLRALIEAAAAGPEGPSLLRLVGRLEVGAHPRTRHQPSEAP